MALKQLYNMAAVLGAGRFGTAIANLVAPNVTCVYLYTHKPEQAVASQVSRSIGGQLLATNVVVTNDLGMVLRDCVVILPVVPAAKFRGLMRQSAAHLRPDHILIHGTKGFDFVQTDGPEVISRFATMSGVILEETVVRQIGCLAGPNLSTELAQKHPTVTVVASDRQKVLSSGKRLLTSDWFHVYLDNDLFSVEVCSVLKNIFAIGSGIIGGMGYQSNTYAFFITMAISEMRDIMATIGARQNALLGPAGLGDVIATCGSSASRNYTIGYRLAKGETLTDILRTAKEVSEGVQTVKIIHQLMQSSHRRQAPITKAIYRMLFEDLPVQQGLGDLFNG